MAPTAEPECSSKNLWWRVRGGLEDAEGFEAHERGRRLLLLLYHS